MLDLLNIFLLSIQESWEQIIWTWLLASSILTYFQHKVDKKAKNYKIPKKKRKKLRKKPSY